MSFALGSSFSTYQIVSLLGAGGMGEVYRARDSKLGREVAIKVLPEAMAGDHESRTRFAREAHLLASLNHPNIAAVHGYEEVDGRCAIVLELVEGVTLSDRLSRGALPVDQAVSIAVQISRALEAAHEKGIVHRDLKPANIRIRPDGTVKVLDFGIAKMLLRVDEASAEAGAMSPTITAEGTMAGMVIGTAAYMSPEQSRGTAVDARTDIWAFGCVLYEMLTGRSAFAGNTMSDTIAAVLKGDPDWAALPPSTPQAVRRLLRRTLHKDPRERLHNIVDARFELQDADASEAAAVPAKRGQLLPIAAAIAAVLVTGFSGWMIARRPSGDVAATATTRFAISLPGDQHLTAYWMLDVSPDGRQVVYVANGQLFLRSFDRLDVTPLGQPGVLVDVPVFSPDGQFIAYSTRSESGSGVELRRISVTGGKPTTICSTGGFTRGMRWVGDRLVFAQGDRDMAGIFEVPAAGGTPRALVTESGGERLSNPDVLDDEDTLVFTSMDKSAAPTLVAASLKTGQRRVILANVRFGRVLSSGHLLYVRGSTVAVQPIDPATLELSGGPTVVADNLPSTGSSFPYAVNVAVSRSGSLTYMTAPGQLRQPVWIDRAGGRETPLGAPAKPYVYPTISPDGSRVALNVREGAYSNWVWSIANQTLSRVTTEKEDPRYAIWSADSRRLIYSTTENLGRRKLVARHADGSGAPEELSPQLANQYPLTASPDGRFLVFKVGPPAQFGLQALSLGSDRALTSVLAFNGQSVNTAEISPDGRWIVHQEGGPVNGSIVVRPFPNVDSGRWLVSQGGSKPTWSRNGRELFFLTPDLSHIAAMPIGTGTTFAFSRAADVVDVRRFQMALQSGSGDVGRTYDVSHDGQRFLVFASVDNRREEIVVVDHWVNELKSANR